MPCRFSHVHLFVTLWTVACQAPLSLGFSRQECCRKEDPAQGPKSGLLSNTWERIVRGDMCWQSKRFYWERAPGQRAGGEGNPGELLCLVACSRGFYGDGNSFRAVFGQSFWLQVLPGATHIAQPRWVPARRILWGGQTHGVSLWPFLNASGWQCLKGDLMRRPWMGSAGSLVKLVMLSTCRPCSSQESDHSWLFAFLWQYAWGLIALSILNSAISLWYCDLW